MSSQDLYQLTNTQQLAEISNWQQMNSGFAKHPSADALKLLEEAVELCYECGCDPTQVNTVVDEETRKHNARRGFGILDMRHVAEEYGDVLVCLTVFRNKWAIRSVEVVANTLEKIRSRSWTPDKSGILRRPR